MWLVYFADRSHWRDFTGNGVDERSLTSSSSLHISFLLRHTQHCDNKCLELLLLQSPSQLEKRWSTRESDFWLTLSFALVAPLSLMSFLSFYAYLVHLCRGSCSPCVPCSTNRFHVRFNIRSLSVRFQHPFAFNIRVALFTLLLTMIMHPPCWLCLHSRLLEDEVQSSVSGQVRVELQRIPRIQWVCKRVFPPASHLSEGRNLRVAKF